MTTSISPSIDNLARAWASVTDLCASLTPQEWKRETGCPGWSVQDNVSHLIDYEARALGRPAPGGEVEPRPHTKNALGESNEVGVEHRRSRSGEEILAELREVTAARAAQMGTWTAQDLEREVTTPAGPGTVADMVRLRVMDTWAHEQDIRRALGRPGHEEGPVAAEAVAYFARFLPLVVGKRVAPPDGTVIVFEIGKVGRYAIAVSGGRAATLPDGTDPETVTVRLTIPPATFAALVCGRDDIPDDVAVEGDTELGSRILAVVGFMP